MISKRPDRLPVPNRTALLVLGMHRSGTSALARILSFLGATLPRHLAPATPANPTGQWEPVKLVALHDALLGTFGSAWDDWRALPPRWRESEETTSFVARIQKGIEEEYATSPLVVLKDPRLCRTLPLWMSLLERSGFRSAPIIVIRNPLEVAESLRERDGISFEKSMLLWLRHYLDAEYETRHLPRNIVSLDVLLEDWRNLFAQTASRLGLQWPRPIQDAGQDIRGFLDLELHNHRATMAELEAHTEVPSWVKTAYRALAMLCDEPRAAEPKRDLDRIRQAFGESTKIFGVVAFAQTDALKQAQTDVAEARIRADGADALRADLSHERAQHATLAGRHALLEQRAARLESDLAAMTARATQAEDTGRSLQAALSQARSETAELTRSASANLKRAEAAEKQAASLVKDIAELERSRNELALTLKQMTTDATAVRSFAETVSRRTEWIEAELRKQATEGKPAKAELDEARRKIQSLADELQSALANAMTLSKELATTREQLHAQEKQAIQLAADARRHQEALKVAEERLARATADENLAQAEVAGLRAELAEAWALASPATTEPVQAAEAVTTIDNAALDNARQRAQRIEEDLRFERMHVQQLESRLNSWTGLASAALRKITRLGAKPPRPPVRNPRRLSANRATPRS